MREQDASEGVEMISLKFIVTKMWAERKLVAVLTAVTLCLGLVRAFANASYRSEGFFQFGGPIPVPSLAVASDELVQGEKENIGTEDGGRSGRDADLAWGIRIGDFKRYAASFGTLERFEEYLRDRKLENDEGAKELRRLFAAKRGLEDVIVPVYPFTKVDAKELVAQPGSGTNNRIIGLKISYEAAAPPKAQKTVSLLGRYAMDSIIFLIYSDNVKFLADEIRAELARLDAKIARHRIEFESLRRRANELKQIIGRHPNVGRDGGRQIVSITEKTAHYLPPQTLLIATEVKAAEEQAGIDEAKRQQQKKRILLEYYERVRQMIDKTDSGEALLRGLEPVRQQVFKDKNLEDESQSEVHHLIAVDNQTSMNVYLNKSRFIAGPTLPTKSTARPVFAAAWSLILGLFLSAVAVFLRSWKAESGN